MHLNISLFIISKCFVWYNTQSPNQPTQPPEKIHNLTTTYPNDWDSPFYGQVNFPMAKLIIRKNKDYCSEDEGDTDARVTDPSTDELVSIMKEKMMMKKKLGKIDIQENNDIW